MDKEMSKEERKRERAKVVAAVRRLTDQEREYLTSSVYNLRTVEGHLLSPRNRALLAWQARAAGVELSEIGGFAQWQKAGRVVVKGARAFFIVFPRTEKNEDENDVLKGFSTAFVFDRSQTREMTEDEKARPRKARKAATVKAAANDKPVAVVPVAVDRPAPAPVVAVGTSPAAVDLSAILAAFTAA